MTRHQVVEDHIHLERKKKKKKKMSWLGRSKKKKKKKKKERQGGVLQHTIPCQNFGGYVRSATTYTRSTPTDLPDLHQISSTAIAVPWMRPQEDI